MSPVLINLKKKKKTPPIHCIYATCPVFICLNWKNILFSGCLHIMFKSIQYWAFPSLQSNKSVLEWLYKVWVQPCVCGGQHDCGRNQVGLCSESETPSRTLFITVTGQQSLPMRGGCLNLYLLIDLTLGALAAGTLALATMWYLITVGIKLI